MHDLWDQLVQLVNRLGYACAPSAYFVNPWIELGLAAGLFIFVVLLFMKYFGLCSRLRSIRRDMMASSYRIILYRRHPRLVMRTEARALWGNIKYLLFLLPTIVFASILYLLAHDSLANRYAFGSAVANQPIVTRVRPANGNRSLNDAILVSTQPSLAITAQARIPTGSKGGGTWLRMEASEAGLWPLHLNEQPAPVTYLNVGVSHEPAMPMRIIEDVEIYVAYPSRFWWGMRHGWAIFFLLASFVIAVPLLFILRIRL